MITSGAHGARSAVIGAALAALAGPAAAQTPLFADHAPLSITIEGPIRELVRTAPRSTQERPAILRLATGGGTRSFAIGLAPRGLSRRTVCAFPPLRLDVARGSARGTLFAGQNRVKLVTHCRPNARFEQLVVLEYVAYRLYNALTPMSFRVRPLDIAYQEAGSDRPAARHFGFLIEDVDDVARRNGRVELEPADGAYEVDQYDPRATATLALFQYMIGNLDWDYRHGPEGRCCHNIKLIGRAGAAANVVPVPYDLDFSGFVDAPYAVPPAQIRVRNVRTRFFRGRCRHNGELDAVVAQFRARRAELAALIAAEPRLADDTRQRAQAYLDAFFAILDDPAQIEQRLAGRCTR